MITSLRSIVQHLIREEFRRLKEAQFEELQDVCSTSGSTHEMNMCMKGGKKYFLKFPNENPFATHDVSLQTLVEFLSYSIYSLYTGVTIPEFELVYHKGAQRVGLITSPASGKQMARRVDNIESFAKGLSAGIYVDVLLANWDAAGTGNSFYDDATGIATRIDPGGALTYRAQGSRKGDKFSEDAPELHSMLSPGYGGSGKVYQYSDLKLAADTFLSVPWGAIESKINTVQEEVSKELNDMNQTGIQSQWLSEVEEIKRKLKARHAKVKEHAESTLRI